MSRSIYEIIETLKEGEEVTIVLANGDQYTGLYRGTDGEQLILKAKSGDAPDLGWNIDAIEDIVPQNSEPAGDLVKADFVDVKTGRKVAMTFDWSGDEAKVKAEFIPTVDKDENGLYAHLAMKFVQMLAGGDVDDVEVSEE